ncbi:M24 family metallopeptidase [Arthrobacter sp. HMWF013]|uniref:M24 family metallopeptidase n=1 Tax=Arthrobacter sp. HMWF013 TaxID=2056849 RepID=UPI000D3CB1CA|nr:Xaa-Pro peptidase family protein [Arthrobacter sp. HMWF013]PTT70787.1 hypothetical protein DBR22_00200 [Arthrobacter sp. HMWF013]
MDFNTYVKDLTSRPLTKELSFSESEYRSRIEEVRKVMDERNLDVLLITHAPSLSYLSGYQSFGTSWASCLILPREGEPVLNMHGLEIGTAMLTSWIKDIRGVSWSYGGTADQIAGIVKEFTLGNQRVGIQGKRAGLSVELYEGLKAALPGVTLVEASDVVERPRLIKSEAELNYMRQAAQITKKGLAAVLPVIKAGVTDNDIAAVIYETLIAEGSEYFSIQPIVSAGERNTVIHTTFRRTPVQAGETVILEFGATYERYTSPLMHTVAIGTPAPEFEDRARIVNETLDRLFEAVKPGRSAHDVAREVGVGMSKISTLPAASHVYGYSLGIGMPPSWTEDTLYIREGIEQELKPGMTFHSPIVPDVPGEPGVGFSETWVVTETGCEVLTKHDRDLTVVDV